MKPRNKFQKEITSLSKRLPKITEVQERWAYKNCFEHIGKRSAKGVITCLECGHSWQGERGTLVETLCGCTCPHCGTELTIRQTRAYKFKQIEYLCIITKHKGYQVLRFFYLTSHTRKGIKAYYSNTEVVQRWIDPNGKYGTLAMLRPMFCFNDHWQWSSNLEVRPEKHLYNISPSKAYPKMYVLPEIKRNGFTGQFHELTPFEMLHTLLTNNKAETLLKTGQYNLLKHFVHTSFRNIDTYWNSIRIAIRNGYTINDSSMWCDYIDQLRFFGKDTNNLKYVCSDDLHRQHDLYMKKRRAYNERERLEQKRKKAQENEAKFNELKSKFFGIVFTDGTIQIRVLESVDEFIEEGKAMHHCVFTNEYYLKESSLILSATVNGNRIETVEISLESMKVVQSRGVCNDNTEYHDRIIKLVNKNMKHIRSRMAA